MRRSALLAAGVQGIHDCDQSVPMEQGDVRLLPQDAIGHSQCTGELSDGEDLRQRCGYGDGPVLSDELGV